MSKATSISAEGALYCIALAERFHVTRLGSQRTLCGKKCDNYRWVIGSNSLMPAEQMLESLTEKTTDACRTCEMNLRRRVYAERACR